jgi:dipeptidyl aminopeptidase/acylaminoacyl peptidase
MVYFVTGAASVRGVYVSRLDGTDPRRVSDADAPSVPSPSGHLLFVRENALLAQALDRATFQLKGSPFQVADGVAVNRDSEGREFPGISVSTIGAILYRGTSVDGGRQLTWFDRSGTAVARVGNPDAARVSGPLSISPDGRRVALTRTVEGNSDIWLLDLGRASVLSRLTFDKAADGAPLWSPDGRRVAFRSNRDGPLSLYQKPAGGGDDERLLSDSQNNNVAGWSHDGSLLLYLRADSKTLLDIWALPLGARDKPFPVVRSPYAYEEFNPHLSPDGAWIAYQSNESGQFEIYVRRFRDSGGAVPVSTGGGTQPRWRRDGKELFYLGVDRRLMALPIKVTPDGSSVEAGTPVPLFQTVVGGLRAAQREYEVSPDGQRFLIDAPLQGTVSPLVLIQNWKR